MNISSRLDAAPLHAATVVACLQESSTLFTLQVRLDDAAAQAAYRFAPGQFNMLQLDGVGEAPVFVISDPEERDLIGHTLRVLEHVTHGLAALKPGDRVALRGPFGRGWPLQEVGGCDVVIVTGGLDCVHMVSVIHYVLRRRERFGKLVVLQGVQQAEDLVWREQYDRWATLPDTQVLVAASEATASWPWHVGQATDLFGLANFDPDCAVAMLCGPDDMMRNAADALLARGLPESRLYLGMERHMQCVGDGADPGQSGDARVCRDGPVFNWRDARLLLAQRGG